MEHLTPKEREEYDTLLFEAGCYDNGQPRPSGEIGPRMVEHLRDAVQAQRPWAAMVLDDITEQGALARWKSWHKRRVVVELGEGDGEKTVVTTKAAAMSVRRQSEAGVYNQLTLWRDMTREELQQVIDGANRRIASDTKNVQLARKVLALLNRVPRATTAQEAAKALDITLEDYLAEPLPEDKAA